MQDEEFGGFGGPHCMVKGGYGQVTQAMAACLPVHLNSPVAKVTATEGGATVVSESGLAFTYTQGYLILESKGRGQPIQQVQELVLDIIRLMWRRGWIRASRFFLIYKSPAQSI